MSNPLIKKKNYTPKDRDEEDIFKKKTIYKVDDLISDKELDRKYLQQIKKDEDKLKKQIELDLIEEEKNKLKSIEKILKGSLDKEDVGLPLKRNIFVKPKLDLTKLIEKPKEKITIDKNIIEQKFQEINNHQNIEKPITKTLPLQQIETQQVSSTANNELTNAINIVKNALVEAPLETKTGNALANALDFALGQEKNEKELSPHTMTEKITNIVTGNDKKQDNTEVITSLVNVLAINNAQKESAEKTQLTTEIANALALAKDGKNPV